MRFTGFFEELKSQLIELAQLVRTREFWIYFAVVALLCLLAFAGVWMAVSFDPLTRGWLGMDFSCRTGEGQLATIIVGSIAFGLACLFTLGEVVELGRGDAHVARAGTAYVSDWLLAADSPRGGNGLHWRRRLFADAGLVHLTAAGGHALVALFP
ncbi:MAG: hypothetical protein QM739_15650 [Propionivibrio sp.]